MTTRQVTLFLLIVATASAPAPAEERARVHKDKTYTQGGESRHRLDVYAPGDGHDRPIVVWIHGGAWQFGDKSQVQTKPAAFNDRGYVFVSANYRFHPAVTYKDQGDDVARAIRWVRDHAGEYGGDPGRIFLMGHSAGAHLAALVATDERYLKNAGLKLGDLSGVVLLDGAGYDVPRQVQQAALPRLKTLYTTVFTDNEPTQRDASPITHVAPGKSIPPFLILHVASRRDSKAQSDRLASELRQAGVEATVTPAEGKTHATINRELGRPDDAPTMAVFDFLQRRRQAPNP